MKNKILLTIGIFSCGIMVVGALVGWKGKTGGSGPGGDGKAVDAAVIQKSVERGFLLLEKSGYLFVERSRAKCAGCHHNTLTAMATGLALEKDIPVVDSLTIHSVNAMEGNLKQAGNPNQVDQFLPVNFFAPYTLLGLYAVNYQPSMYTDMSVDYMMSQARADGSFLAESGRAPLESGDIHLTAMTIRAIRLYASSAKQAHVDILVTKTRQWLEGAKPVLEQEIVFQLLGMQWCGSDADQKARVAEKLRSMQHGDGGWSQLTTLGTDAYATGQALYALFESGMVQAGDDVYQKGISYLLKTQDESGAWIVATRSFPIQPFFSSDFPPYDENQYISATASNWSIMALMEALPDKKR